jgi:hypothetical protein
VRRGARSTTANFFNDLDDPRRARAVEHALQPASFERSIAFVNKFRS